MTATNFPSQHTPRIIVASLATIYTLTSQVAFGQASPNDKARAVNLGRNAAIALNGGISKYVPEKCMFDTGTPLGLCLTKKDQYGYLFQFVGGPPGWQPLGMAPTVQTSILISLDGRSVLNIFYNGPVSGRQ